MSDRIKELALQCKLHSVVVLTEWNTIDALTDSEQRELIQLQQFADLIIKDCIAEIENYQIPVGNSAAGEMACEWTYDALKEIRANIKDRFGIK